MAERKVMSKVSTLVYATNVFFNHIEIIESHNGRLVLGVYIDADANTVYDEMIIYEGKYHFRGGFLKKLKTHRKRAEEFCNRCQEEILKEANSLCEDFGLPELTEEY